MVINKIRTAGLVLAGLSLMTAPAFAQHGGHRNGGGQANRGDDGRSSARANESRGDTNGRAVPRNFVASRNYSPRVVRPIIVNRAPYRPYVYRYRPGFSASFIYGAPYYGYRYGYTPYGYGYEVPPAGYLSAIPGRAYGGVRITDAPRDAQVFVDGYYMGVVDDFDGVFQHMNLEAGPHHVEIREPGFEAIAFDVNVQPDQTTTFRAEMLPEQPQQ